MRMLKGSFIVFLFSFCPLAILLLRYGRFSLFSFLSLRLSFPLPSSLSYLALILSHFLWVYLSLGRPLSFTLSLIIFPWRKHPFFYPLKQKIAFALLVCIFVSLYCRYHSFSVIHLGHLPSYCFFRKNLNNLFKKKTNIKT